VFVRRVGYYCAGTSSIRSAQRTALRLAGVKLHTHCERVCTRARWPVLAARVQQLGFSPHSLDTCVEAVAPQWPIGRVALRLLGRRQVQHDD
jgi:hypothetical protein